MINVDRLTERFDVGTEVTPDLLREHGLLRGRKVLLKVLARGEISKAIVVSAHKFSGRAVEKIVGAGGRATVITP